MFVPFFALHVSVTRLTIISAQCSSLGIEPLMMVSLGTETCRAKKDTNILMFLE